MIGIWESYPALPIVPAIIVCVVGLIALFAFAAVYLELQRYANQLPQDRRDQGISELGGSLLVLPLLDPKRASIIPTIGKAFVLDTTERIPTS